MMYGGNHSNTSSTYSLSNLTAAGTSVSSRNGSYGAADVEADHRVTTYLTAFLAIAYGTISVLSVFGNGLIIWAVLANKRMHNVTNYFISNLALADVVIGLFATPFQFQAALLQRWIFPQIMCKVAPFSSTLSVNVSILTLVAISLDRYYVILHPFKPKLRVKQCFIILICIWIAAFALSAFHLYTFRIYVYGDRLECAPDLEPKMFLLFKYHTIFLVVVQYLVPFVIISLTYFRIGYHIYFDDSPNSVTKNQEKNKRKVIKMIFIVVSLFMVCWAPIQLYNFLNIVYPDLKYLSYIHIYWFFANWFAMSNSCYNVFIYGACSARYKIEFRRILSFLPCVRKEFPDLENPNLDRRLTFRNSYYSQTTLTKKNSTILINAHNGHLVNQQLKHNSSSPDCMKDDNQSTAFRYSFNGSCASGGSRPNSQKRNFIKQQQLASADKNSDEKAAADETITKPRQPTKISFKTNSRDKCQVIKNGGNELKNGSSHSSQEDVSLLKKSNGGELGTESLSGNINKQSTNGHPVTSDDGKPKKQLRSFFHLDTLKISSILTGTKKNALGTQQANNKHREKIEMADNISRI